MKIRKYEPQDRKAVEEIQYITSTIGEHIKRITNTRNLSARAVNYYLTKEPENSFILENKGKIVGYLLGCFDSSKKHHATSILAEYFGMFFKTRLSKSKKRTSILEKIYSGIS